MSEGGSDSPRYLTPPDLNACGDRVLVSMEDKTIGIIDRERERERDRSGWKTRQSVLERERERERDR